MSHTITNTITYAIRNSFQPHTSKRYEKLNSKTWQDQGRSWSGQTLQNRLDLGKQFGRFLKQEYPDVRMARDIKLEHYNAFLELKAHEGVSAATLDRYASDLRSISRELATTYNEPLNFKPKQDIKPPQVEKVINRTNKGIDKADIEKLIESSSHNKSQELNIMLNLSYTFGLRSGGGSRADKIKEIRACDIKMDEKGNVYCEVTEKGGRTRQAPPRNQEAGLNMWKWASSLPNQEENLIHIKPQSLDKALAREMDKLGFKEKYVNVKEHGIRKAYAQELYDNYRKEGHTKLQTIGYVNLALGHSADRDVEILEKYVANVW